MLSEWKTMVPHIKKVTVINGISEGLHLSVGAGSLTLHLFIFDNLVEVPHTAPRERMLAIEPPDEVPCGHLFVSGRFTVNESKAPSIIYT